MIMLGYVQILLKAYLVLPDDIGKPDKASTDSVSYTRNDLFC